MTTTDTILPSPIDWEQLIRERDLWVAYNFPNDKLYCSIQGAVEELGELMHCHLKFFQGIRTNEDLIADGQDAVGDLVIYLLGVLSMWGTPYAMVQREYNADRAILLLAADVGAICCVPAGYSLLPGASRIIADLRNYCKLRGWDFERIVNETWAKVKQRDWIKYPETGKPPAAEGETVYPGHPKAEV